MHKRVLVSIAAGILFALPNVAHAQLNDWVRIHPDGAANNLGGAVTMIVTDADGTQYIRSSFDRYYSRPDSATAWESFSPELGGAPIKPINVLAHPVIAGRLTANNDSDLSVIRSLDYGRTWSLVSASPVLVLMARSPVSASTFYGRDSDSNTLYTSIDDGASWSGVAMTDFGEMNDLEIDGVNAGVFYAVDGSRFKKSIDSGSTWQIMESGTFGIGLMSDIAISTLNTDNLYSVGILGDFAFRSTNGANSWSVTNLPNLPGTGSRMEAVKIDPSNQDKIFAVGRGSSIFSSSDAGVSWAPFVDVSGLSSWTGLSISQTGDVVMGGRVGTAIPGASNEIVMTNQGFSDFSMNKIVSSPGDDRFSYAGGENGIAIYDSTADAWSVLSRPFDNDVLGLSVDAGNSEVVYVASFQSELFVTTNAGAAWQEVTPPAGTSFGLDVELAPSNSSIIYFRSEDGLFRSADAGVNWNLILEPELFDGGDIRNPIVVSTTDADTLTLGTSEFGLYTTFDGGLTWQSTVGQFADDTVTGISRDPFNSDILYAVLQDGHLLVSADLGDTWVEQDASAITGDFGAVNLDPFVPGRVHVFSAGQLHTYEPSLDAWSAAGAPDSLTCDPDACQVLPDSDRQGYIVMQAGGELFALQRDSDTDAVGDDVDNCTLVQNPAQIDTDGDGFGNYCDPDYNNDNVVNFVDVVQFTQAYLSTDPNIDMNGDGIVNFVDFSLLAGYFLMPPGPGAQGFPAP